jgi:hypothetical protein
MLRFLSRKFKQRAHPDIIAGHLVPRLILSHDPELNEFWLEATKVVAEANKKIHELQVMASRIQETAQERSAGIKEQLISKAKEKGLIEKDLKSDVVVVSNGILATKAGDEECPCPECTWRRMFGNS